MKAERLFRAIGLVDEGLIEAAAETPAKKNWTSASPTIGDRSRRRRSGFWRNVSARFCGDRRRITGISSCGAIGTARISPPSQSVWIAARAG